MLLAHKHSHLKLHKNEDTHTQIHHHLHVYEKCSKQFPTERNSKIFKLLSEKTEEADFNVSEAWTGDCVCVCVFLLSCGVSASCCACTGHLIVILLWLFYRIFKLMWHFIDHQYLGVTCSKELQVGFEPCDCIWSTVKTLDSMLTLCQDPRLLEF